MTMTRAAAQERRLQETRGTTTTELIQLPPIDSSELAAYRDALTAAVVALETSLDLARLKRADNPDSDYWPGEILRLKRALKAANDLRSPLY